MLTRPEEIAHVLLRDQQAFVKSHVVKQDRQVFGQGLLTSDGELWRRQHRLMQPAFRRDRLPAYADQAVASADACLADWRPGEVRDLHFEMTCLMAQVAVRTLFGADLARRDAERVADAMTESFAVAMDGVGAVSALLPKWLPTRRGRRFQRAFGELEDLVHGLIARRRALRRRGDPGPPDDVLALLLRGLDQEGGGAAGEEQQVRDEVMTLLIAGSETTAIAIAWTAFLLATHPAVAAAVEVEVDTRLRGRTPRAADLPQLSLMQRVLAESLRLYPPAHTLLRTTACECEVGGYRMPAGMVLVMSPWVVHRDRHRFEEPDAFRPERWRPDSADRIARGAYFPFSCGPRVCIAMSYARTVSLVILTRLVQRFRLTLAADSPIVPHAAALLRPRQGVPMVVQPRWRT